MRVSFVRPCGALFVLLGAVLAFGGQQAVAGESVPAGGGPVEAVPIRLPTF